MILTGSDGREISRIALHFTAAAVTDASTDENGVGHISVKAETEQLTLLLTLVVFWIGNKKVYYEQ